MRGRSTKRTVKELEKNKPKEGGHPHLSGAYIRSLVKQLTSSKSKLDPPPTPNSPAKEMDKSTHEALSQSQPPQPPKKQVRRRLHTSRPYQERLLNMAEARREIVTALKFHRAAMKQASQEQQQQQQQLAYTNPIENLNSNMNANFPCNLYYYPPLSPSFPWTSSSPAITLPITDTFNLPLPNQPLGLNLTFHDFNNIDTNSFQYHHNNESSSNSTTSCLPSTSSSTLSSPSPYTEVTTVVLPNSPSPPAGGMHHAMDDREMAEIRSIGEQHDMEWNDTVNLVTSAWWFKFLKTMESGKEERTLEYQDHGLPMVDDLMDIPAWLNIKDGGPATCVTQASDLMQHEQLFDHDLPR